MGERRSPPWTVLLVVWIVVAVALLLNYRPFSVASVAMAPTLQTGDYTVISKIAYGISRYSLPFAPNLFSGRLFARPPARGDVVVFALPRDDKVDYIKRVIGLPGETVQMKQGRLYIDGKLVPREPVKKIRSPSGDGGEVPTYRETLPNGVAYTIIEIQGDTGFNDDTELFKVPAGQYFVMGDNRDNSIDSRIPADRDGVGYVPFENFVGRVELLVYRTAGGGPTLPFARIK